MVQSPHFDGKIPQWRHLKCHFIKGNRGLTSISMLGGKDDIRPDDANKVKLLIDPSAAAASAASATTTTTTTTSSTTTTTTTATTTDGKIVLIKKQNFFFFFFYIY